MSGSQSGAEKDNRLLFREQRMPWDRPAGLTDFHGDPNHARVTQL